VCGHANMVAGRNPADVRPHRTRSAAGLEPVAPDARVGREGPAHAIPVRPDVEWLVVPRWTEDLLHARRSSGCLGFGREHVAGVSHARAATAGPDAGGLARWPTRGVSGL